MNTTPQTAWNCPPKRIVVGVDFGDASARAIAIARFFGAAFQSHITAVHAERFEPPAYFTLEQISRLEREAAATRAAAAAHLATFSATSAFQVDPVVLDAPPVDAILDVASDADLVIVGTHGRRGPGRWWLGSVAERVVRAATIPVLVTRASTSATRDVFDRVAFLSNGAHDGGRAHTCAERLADVGRSALVEAGRASECSTADLNRASLVVIATSADRSAWGLTAPVARVLASCERPVLFVPAE